jgi:hypothetical protein
VERVTVLRGVAPQDLGSGSGSGSGSGDGDGSGYGDGYGDGSGSGDGDGSGYGSGSGSGYGDGDGYGDGYGYGYGDGDGSSSGSGDGYWLASIPVIVAGWPEAQRERYAAAQGEGATIAFWRSHADGTPSNGGKGPAREVGTLDEVRGPLALCGARALHATLEPGKWRGDRVWIVALFGEVQHQEDKCGALRREILGEAWSVPKPA